MDERKRERGIGIVISSANGYVSLVGCEQERYSEDGLWWSAGDGPGVKLHAQGNVEGTADAKGMPHVYAERIEMSGDFTLENARNAVKVLGPVEKRMRAMYEARGPWSTVGEWACRVAEATGLPLMRWNHAQDTYEALTGADARRWIDDAWDRAQRPGAYVMGAAA